MCLELTDEQFYKLHGPCDASALIHCTHRTGSDNQHIQQVGKHRSVWEPEPKPNGYWRSEFPTTQEIQNDREEEKRIDAEKLRKVAEEAARGDGRWKKKDTK